MYVFIVFYASNEVFEKITKILGQPLQCWQMGLSIHNIEICQKSFANSGTSISVENL